MGDPHPVGRAHLRRHHLNTTAEGDDVNSPGGAFAGIERAGAVVGKGPHSQVRVNGRIGLRVHERVAHRFGAPQGEARLRGPSAPWNRVELHRCGRLA